MPNRWLNGFGEHLLQADCVPGTVLGTENAEVNSTVPSS